MLFNPLSALIAVSIGEMGKMETAEDGLVGLLSRWESSAEPKVDGPKPSADCELDFYA